ncbi:GGDEF domain-containing protein [Lactobacillus delbrueckii subsp. bulgaricus]
MKQVKILDLKFDTHISAGYVYGQAQTPDEVYEMIREADRMLYQRRRQCPQPDQRRAFAL